MRDRRAALDWTGVVGQIRSGERKCLAAVARERNSPGGLWCVFVTNVSQPSASKPNELPQRTLSPAKPPLVPPAQRRAGSM